MQVLIYQPSKVATQSGRANTQYWILEFQHDGSRMIESIMGWHSSSDTLQEVRLKFSTKEKAVKYAKKNNLDYQVSEPTKCRIKPKSYANNFK